MKLKVLKEKHSDGQSYYLWWCVGCNGLHQISVPRWTFNGDLDSPTFSPSYLIYESKDASQHRCHSFIENGKMKYLGDCGHKLAGQVVEIPDVNTWI